MNHFKGVDCLKMQICIEVKQFEGASSNNFKYSPVVLLNSKAKGSQGLPDAESSIMSGHASPVAHLEKRHKLKSNGKLSFFSS